MDQQRIDMYVMTNIKYFPAEKVMYLKERMQYIDEQRFSWLCTAELKDPTTYLLISIFLGSLGVDRFMLGETGMGILKLLTGGCCGVLTIVDWCTITGKVKEANFNKVMSML